jgi:pimeloyl-ACP methyl ester carboxylesterase
MQTSTLAFLAMAGTLWCQSLPRLAPAGFTFRAEQGRLVVGTVKPGSNGARAGLEPGDVLITADGSPVDASATSARSLLRHAAPASIHLTVQRSGQTRSIVINYRLPPSEPNVLYGALAVQGHLRRTFLTLPTGAGRHPAILFLPGSGCGSQESPSLASPESQILHALTAAGYATLRVEKPGVGDSTGPPCYSVEADLALDLEAYREALAFLRQHQAIRSDRMFLFAHSAGATLAPFVAKAQNLRGILLNGVMGTSFANYVFAMRERIATLGNLPTSQRQLTRTCLERLLRQGQSVDAIVAAQPACRQEVYFDSPPAYIAQWNTLNLAEAWRAQDIPVLLLYGRADFVSSESESRALLKKIRSRSKRMLTLPMDHGFLAADNPKQAWEIETGRRPSPGLYPPVITHILTWLERQP